MFLHSAPSWSEVKEAMKSIAEKTSFDLNLNSSKVLQQYDFVRNYCSAEKLASWNKPDKDKRTTRTEDRWVEIFNYFDKQNVPYIEFSQIVEYVLCLPGTSAPVERIFSIAKKIWKLESASLHMETLKSILFVKHNIELTCTEFYEFLKTQPELLRKISSQNKYSFKQPVTPADNNMSIDLDSTTDDMNENENEIE